MINQTQTAQRIEDVETLASNYAQEATARSTTIAMERQSRKSHIEFVRNYLLARRMRDEHLPAEIFADPGWDIMLDIYVSWLEGKAVSISSCCIAAGVPASTALRWINRLAELNLVERKSDLTDRRRSYLELMPRAYQGVHDWVERVMVKCRLTI